MQHPMKSLILVVSSLLAAPFASAQDTAQAELGKSMFMVCSACHGPDAKGLDVGPQKMAPPLAGSKIANGKPEIFAMVVLKGIRKEGTQWQGIMAPLEESLDDARMAAVMTYVRSNFGNTSSPVTPEQVKAFREQWKALKEPVTRAKIEELSK
jgi:mono/diheme cytochrome c family protein